MSNGTSSPNINVGSKPWILVVEDDELLRKSVSEALNSNGYNCLAVENFSKALAKIQNQQFSCIILDLKLGEEEKNGKDILNNIRTSFSCTLNKVTPVLVCSGYIEPAIIRDHKDLISGALAKPFKIQDLLQKVATCIQLNINTQKSRASAN